MLTALTLSVGALCLFHSMGCRRDSDDEERRHVIALLDSAETAHSSNRILDSFEILAEAREKSHRNHFAEEYRRSINMLSRLYAYIDDADEARLLNEEVYGLAVSSGDSLEIMRALNNKGVIAGIIGDNDSALETFHELLRTARTLNDSTMQVMAWRNIAGMEIERGNFPEALRFIDLALGMTTEEGVVWDLMNMKATAMQSEGESVKAMEIYDSLLVAPTSPASMSAVLRKAALLKADDGGFEEALDYLKRSDVVEDPISRYLLYLDYGKVHEAGGNLRTACAYKDSALKMMDTIHSFAQHSYHLNSSVRFSLLKKEEEARVARLNAWVWGLAGLLLITLLCGAYALLLRKRKVERLTSQLELVRMRDELEKTRQEQTELQATVDEYLEKLKRHELSLASRDNIMREVADYLTSTGDSGSNKLFLARMREMNTDSANIDRFLEYTRQTRPELFATLAERFPALNHNDLKYISLVLLQLSVNEAAAILNITPAASKKRKQRICGKLGLDSTVDLYSYLSGI